MPSISDFAADEPKKPEFTPDEVKETPTAEAPEAPPAVAETPAPAPEPPTAAPAVDQIADSILSRIAPIGSSKMPLKMMVFGEPGTTKSSFISTAVNNLIVDFENGLISAKSSPHGIGDGTQAIPYTNFEDFVQLIRMVKEHHPNLEQFETFSIDTFSDLHKRGLAEVVQREHRRRPSMNQYVAEVEHHTENNEKLLRIIRILRDLDRNLLITAHSKTVEPKGKPAKTYADFSESLSNKIMAQMDIVGYMYMKKIDGVQTPVMRVVSDDTITAKTRIALPEEIANPTFPKILRAWEESKK